MEVLDVTQTHCVVIPAEDELAVSLLQRLHQINQLISQVSNVLSQSLSSDAIDRLITLARNIDQLFSDNNQFQARYIRALDNSERETVVTITQDLLIKFQPQIQAMKNVCNESSLVTDAKSFFHNLQQALIVNLSSTVLLRAIDAENLDHQLDVFNKLFTSKDLQKTTLIQSLMPALQVFSEELDDALRDHIAQHIQTLKKTMLETDQWSLFQTIKQRFENTYLVTLTLIKLHLQNDNSTSDQVIGRFRQLIESFIALCNKNYELIKHKEKLLKHRLSLRKNNRSAQSQLDQLEANFNQLPFSDAIESVSHVIPCIEQHKSCFAQLSQQYDILIQHLPRATLDPTLQDTLARCEDLYIDLVESFSALTLKTNSLTNEKKSISVQLNIRLATQQLNSLTEKRDCANLLGVIQDCESANQSFDFEEGDPYEKMSIVDIGQSINFLNAAVKQQLSTLRDEIESSAKTSTQPSLTTLLRNIIKRFEKNSHTRFAPQQIEELLQRQHLYSRQLHKAHDHIEKMIVAAQTKALLLHPNDFQRLLSYKAQSQLLYSQLLTVQPALNQLKNSLRKESPSHAFHPHPEQSQLLLVCSHPFG